MFRSQHDLIKRITSKVSRIAQWSRNLFEAISLVKFHSLRHRIERFEITDLEPDVAGGFQATRKNFLSKAFTPPFRKEVHFFQLADGTVTPLQWCDTTSANYLSVHFTNKVGGA